MKILNKQEFENFYNEEIKPSIEPIDKDYKRVCKIGIISLFIFALYGIILYIIYISRDMFIDLTWPIFILFLLIFIFLTYILYKNTKINKRIKKIILPKIFASFELLYLSGDKSYIPLNKIKEWKLFPQSSNKKNDDVIIGAYNSRNFLVNICQLTHPDNSSNDNKSSDIIDFCGFIMKIKIKQKLKGKTIVALKNKILNNNNFYQVKLEFLENIKGNRVIYSSNIEEAKKLLTPLFLEKINNLDKLSKNLTRSNEMAFTSKEDRKEEKNADKVNSLLYNLGEYSVNSNIMAVLDGEFLYLFVPTYPLLFDINYNPAKLLEDSYNNYLIMKTLLNIIDDMNLEENFNL